MGRQSFHDCLLVIHSFIDSLLGLLIEDANRFSIEEVLCNCVHVGAYFVYLHLGDLG